MGVKCVTIDFCYTDYFVERKRGCDHIFSYLFFVLFCFLVQLGEHGWRVLSARYMPLTAVSRVVNLFSPELRAFFS